MRPAGSPEELQRRRQRAVELLNQGLQPVEVAQRIGVDRRSVRRWKAAYRKQGKQALRAIPASGRPPKLDAKAKVKLERACSRVQERLAFLPTCGPAPG